VRLPAYRTKWKVTVIDAKSRQVRYQKTFTGEDPPGNSVEFVIPHFTDQWVVFEDDKRYDGGEVLFGDRGGVEFVGDKRVVGIVGRGPGKEVLAWLEGLMGEENGAK
jgi:hypothetical protein